MKNPFRDWDVESWFWFVVIVNVAAMLLYMGWKSVLS